MSEEIEPDDVERLVARLDDAVGDALQVVGVGWAPDDVAFPYVRDDVAEAFSPEVLEDIGVDLLADRHLETGNLRRHGLEGPTISGRLYDQALLVVCWIEALPVGVMTDPEPRHFAPVVDVLEDEIERVV